MTTSFQLPFDPENASPFMEFLLDEAFLAEIEGRVRMLATASLGRQLRYLASKPATALASVVVPSEQATTEELVVLLRRFYAEWVVHYCLLSEMLRRVEALFEQQLQRASESALGSASGSTVGSSALTIVHSLHDRILHDERQYQNDIVSLWGILHEYPALIPYVLEGKTPPVGVEGEVFFRSAWLWFRRRQRYRALFAAFAALPELSELSEKKEKVSSLYGSNWDIAAVRVGEIFPTSGSEQEYPASKSAITAVSAIRRLFWEWLLSVESSEQTSEQTGEVRSAPSLYAAPNSVPKKPLTPPFTKYWDWRWETHSLPRRVLLRTAEWLFAERDALHRVGLALCWHFRQAVLKNHAHLLVEKAGK